MRYHRKHDQHAPRSWFRLFLRYGGWASIAFGVFLVILTFISAAQLRIADRMDRDGRFTTAVVMDKEIETRTDSDGDTVYDYMMTLRYKTPDGGVEARRDVGKRFYSDVDVGGEVPIRYLRSKPDVMEYEIDAYRSGGNVVRWVGLLFGIIGLFLLWRFGERATDAVRARRFGEKRFAVVTGITETSWEVNDRKQAKLDWREEDGQVGQSLMRDRMYLSERYRSGDKIVVFRLGDKSFWEGDIGPPSQEYDRKAE